VYKKQIVESKTNTHHKSIEELKSEMKLAVDNEDFEKAAQIRDLIKSFNK
jgi:protein-arginine kinase activator protein McsA